MKKILIFSLAYYPRHVSGAEAAVREITDRIAPDDIAFHLITHRFGNDLREEHIGNVHVHRVGFGPSYVSKIFFIPVCAWRARALHRQERFDALWSIMTYMLLPVVLARILGVRIPYVLTLQDGDSYEKVFHRWFIRPILPLLDYGFRHAAAVQTISHYLATWPPKRGYQGPVSVIPNGPDPNDLNDVRDERAVREIHERYGKRPGDIWLINTARLEPQKAFDVTIRALPLLPDTIRLLVVGGGREERALRELVRELGLESRVFFAGQVSRDVVTEYRHAADIFVGPSRSEGLGNAFLSAMGSRLPVIATQEGGLADYMFDARRNPDKPATGWVVDKDAPAQIAAAVQNIIADPEGARRVTERARAMVLEKYDWYAITAQMREQVFAQAFMPASHAAERLRQ